MPLPSWCAGAGALAAALLVLLGAPRPAAATDLLPGQSETQVVTGLDSPTAMTVAPGGRVLVSEQGGALRVVRDDALLPTPMLNLPVSRSGERGLLGVVLDPAFPAEPYLYAYYTVPGDPPHNRVSRFTVAGDVADPASEVVLLDLPPLRATIHNGGLLMFLPDGTLLVATGENSRPELAPDPASAFGKILRINRDGSVPADNPAAGAEGVAALVWARGLRNPFSGDVQPGTGRVFVNDVGQASWEEVDEILPGIDLGWPSTEGPTSRPGVTPPLHAYSSAGGAECAITGGAFYDPATSRFPSAYRGTYLFADYCAGWIRRYDPASGAVTDLANGTVPGTVALRVESDGDILYLTRNEAATGARRGMLMRISSTGAPTVAAQPEDVLTGVGEPAGFTVRASGDPPFTYRWQRDGVDVPGATGPTLTVPDPVLGDDGARYRCVVDGPTGSVTTREAVLRVTTDQRPVPSITLPATGTTYAAGDVIPFAGGAVDPEEGELPPAALSWRVDFHHDTHSHPFLAPTSGTASGTITVPTEGETSPDVWFRIRLTATDSVGRTATASVDVHPQTARMTVTSDPPGLYVALDGAYRRTPFTVTGVTGVRRTLTAPDMQKGAPGLLVFDGWERGWAPSRALATPATDTTYTARYSRDVPE